MTTLNSSLVQRKIDFTDHMNLAMALDRGLFERKPIEELDFKKPSGTWSDKQIRTFSRRLNVEFPLTEEVARKIRPSEKYGDRSPMSFLADRRNAIAHGRRSFEDGASDMTVQEIKALSDLTIGYLEAAVAAFQGFLDQRKYLATEDE